jgi:hypothetical protein
MVPTKVVITVIQIASRMGGIRSPRPEVVKSSSWRPCESPCGRAAPHLRYLGPGSCHPGSRHHERRGLGGPGRQMGDPHEATPRRDRRGLFRLVGRPMGHSSIKVTRPVRPPDAGRRQRGRGAAGHLPGCRGGCRSRGGTRSGGLGLPVGCVNPIAGALWGTQPDRAEKDALTSDWWFSRTLVRKPQRPCLPPQSCDQKRWSPVGANARVALTSTGLPQDPAKPPRFSSDQIRLRRGTRESVRRAGRAYSRLRLRASSARA